MVSTSRPEWCGSVASIRREHWEFAVGIGHQAVLHDDDHTVLVPVGEHAAALLKAGYEIAD